MSKTTLKRYLVLTDQPGTLFNHGIVDTSTQTIIAIFHEKGTAEMVTEMLNGIEGNTAEVTLH